MMGVWGERSAVGGVSGRPTPPLLPPSKKPPATSWWARFPETYTSLRLTSVTKKGGRAPISTPCPARPEAARPQ